MAISDVSQVVFTEFPEQREPEAGAPLQVELVSARHTDDVMQEWESLEERLGEPGLLCSAVWTRTWLRHYSDLVPRRFAVARRGGTVCGVCLVPEGVGQKDGPVPVRTLHVGTAGEPDAHSVCVEYNRLLVEPDCRAEFAHRLVETLEREMGWDELRFDGFPAAEVDASALPGEWGVREVECCYYDLQTQRKTAADALSGLGYSTRKNIRKNLKAYDRLTCEWAETVERAEAIFDDMVRLHQARWNAAGEPGSYASDRFRRFHEDLLRQLVPRGRMGLFRVRSDGETVGCVQVLIDGKRALCYQGGSAPYTGKLSPGVIVDYLCIEECLARGFDAYDFLGGDSHHKRKLSTDATSLCWLHRRRPRMKFALLNAGRRIKRRWCSRSIPAAHSSRDARGESR